MKGEATYKVLQIPGSGVGYLDSDRFSDFTLLSLNLLISTMGRIAVVISQGDVWPQRSQSSRSSLTGLEENFPLKQLFPAVPSQSGGLDWPRELSPARWEPSALALMGALAFLLAGSTRPCWQA